MIQGRFVSEDRERRIAEDIFCKASLHPYLQETCMERKDSLIQALVYEGAEDSCPAAAGCMSMKQEEARILSVAVLPEYRGKAYGEFVIRMLIDKAKTNGIKRVTLSCQNEMSGYFQKLGFREDEKSENRDRIVCINMTYEVIDGKCCSKSI